MTQELNTNAETPASAKSPPPETFRTVHETLGEVCRVIDASADGLAELSSSSKLGVRDRLMLETLMRVRREAGSNLWSAFAAASEDTQRTWIQAAPVFAIGPDLAQRVVDSGGAQQASQLVTESDAKLEKALETMSGSSSVARQSLEQTRAKVIQLAKTCRSVVLGADDM